MNHPRPGAALVLSLLLLPFTAAPLTAQENLVENPGFDMDFSGWQNPEARPGFWDPMDFAGNLDSGSAFLSNEGRSNAATPSVLVQCHLVKPSTEYTFGHQILVPSGQPEGTQGDLFAITYAEDDCPGVNALQLENARGGEVGKWVTVSETIVTDPDTQSLRLALGIWKPNGEEETASTYLDNIFLYETELGTYRIINELLSGTWFNPATPGQGIFLDISRGINLFFGGWFAWTTTPGEIFWWTVQGNFNGELATVLILRSSGGALNDPARVDTVSVGMGEFRFRSCTAGEFRYKFDGDSEYTVIPLSRLAPAFNGCED